MAGLDPSAAPPRRTESGIFSPLARGQYRALAWLQTRIFANSLRTRRGKSELVARVFSFVLFGIIALAPAIGLGFGAWAMVSEGHLRAVGLLLWLLFLVWQFFAALAPVLAGQNPELSHLLRFPVSFGSWILLYLVYGLVAPSTLIGTLWAAAIGIGVSAARPQVFLWTALTLALFVLFNLLLSRMILAWIERWMAQRRTREIITGILLFAALAAQTLNPAFHQHSRGTLYGIRHDTVALIADRAWTLQTALPPGLATGSVLGALQNRPARAAADFSFLGLYTLAAGALLAWRLRAESRGENLSEAPRRAAPVKARAPAASPALFNFSGPIAAVFEKDLRYLLRSGPMLYNLAAPLVMVFLFGGTMRTGKFSGFRLEYALPIGIVWAFLGLTRLICNNLGTEGEGIQFYFLAPTPIRTVILGKNFLHFVILLLEAALISVLVIVRFGVPAPSMAAATVGWILFAVPANFSAGNLLSVLMPYRMNLVRIRREPGALGNGLLGMLSQFAILGIGAAVLVPCTAFGHPWLAAPIFLLLAAVAVGAYLRILGNVDRMVQSRRESLILDMAKTA